MTTRVANHHADHHRARRAQAILGVLDELTKAAGYEPAAVAMSVQQWVWHGVTPQADRCISRRETLSKMAGIRGVASDETLRKVRELLGERARMTEQLGVNLSNLLGDVPQVTCQVCSVCGAGECRKEACADEAGIRGVDRFVRGAA